MNGSIILILIVTAVATSSLGVFLVLRKMSMLVDAISHTVLLGIVIAFIFVGDLSSPLLIIGATVMGLLTIFLTETLIKSKKTAEDSATGLIFPLLFSIAVIIISTSFSGVHLDIDAVLLGKIEFAPFDKLFINQVSIGPKLFYIMLGVALLNVIFIRLFFKELKIISFDSALATAIGFLPAIIHYLLMFFVSLTAVTAFNAVGSILVIALMIGPAASATMITKDLKHTILLAIGIGIINSIIGYWLALLFDTNISGMIATITLFVFLLVFIFEPHKGLVITIVKRHILKKQFAFTILIFHLYNHPANEKETKYNVIQKELNWSPAKTTKQIEKGIQKGYIKIENDFVLLTEQGTNYYNLLSKELSKT